jgi:P27 family predicted phage terminase small subunit
MGRGRKPKPTTLKLLSGAQPCRINAGEPLLPAGRPLAPEHLDQVAREEWDRIAARLESMGVLTEADGAALAIYCVAYSRWIEARRAIDAHGLVIETSLGGVKPNPAVSIASACESTMGRILAAFGLTPADRSKVKAAGPAASKLAKFRKA